jgi:hypothetical protein
MGQTNGAKRSPQPLYTQDGDSLGIGTGDFLWSLRLNGQLGPLKTETARDDIALNFRRAGTDHGKP